MNNNSEISSFIQNNVLNIFVIKRSYYVPSMEVLPDFVTKWEGERNDPPIPGAVFAQGIKKKGIITKWEGGKEGFGHIINTEREEKICLVRGLVVVEEQTDDGWNDMVGRRVEYYTRRKGKKLEAVKVWMVHGGLDDDSSHCKGPTFRPMHWMEGWITHWVPAELAGVIMTVEGEELLVNRKDFTPEGFDPRIVGRKVKFLLDTSGSKATCVEVIEEDCVNLSRVEEDSTWTQVNIIRIHPFFLPPAFSPVQYSAPQKKPSNC